MWTLTTHADAALGVELGGGLVELVLQRSLDPEVDGERHRPVVGHLGADVLVQRGLGAGQALAAGIREADDMRAGVAQRIDPLLLRLEADAGQAEVMHLGAQLRGEAADHEGAPSRAQRLFQALRRQLRQVGGERAAGLGGVPDLSRVDVEAVVQQVRGQHLAVAVDDVGAPAPRGVSRRPCRRPRARWRRSRRC